MLLAREPLLLRGGDDLAVANQGGGAVVVEGRDAEDPCWRHGLALTSLCNPKAGAAHIRPRRSRLRLCQILTASSKICPSGGNARDPNTPVVVVPALLAVVVVAAAAAAPASAQTARATGTVRDTSSKPIKGATIRAVNPDAVPSEVTSVCRRQRPVGDARPQDRPDWTFIAEAPGFFTVKVRGRRRAPPTTPPLNFILAHDPGPIPGALTQNIQAQIGAANTLRDQGRYDRRSPRFRTSARRTRS